MQRLSDVVAMSATPQGELVLAIQTDDVRVSTTWENCQRPIVGACLVQAFLLDRFTK